MSFAEFLLSSWKDVIGTDTQNISREPGLRMTEGNGRLEIPRWWFGDFLNGA